MIPARPTAGVTIFGCEQDEATLFRALAPGLGIVPTITPAPVSDRNAGLAGGNRCISIGHKTLVRASTLLALADIGVRYISTRSVGYNHVDVEYAERVGIRVETVEYSPDSVADHTLMLMLMTLRHMRSVVRRTDLHDYRLHEVRGRELRDLTVGVIGTGRIGCAVIDRLRGFGCRTLAHDLRPKAAVDYLAIEALLEQSDVVTLHTPLTAATRHLLDRHRISRIKRGAIVVNTGRGPLLDTEALVGALESGRLGGAALDVVEGEEGVFYADRRTEPVGSELWRRLHRLENVLITPHTAFYTDHALRDTVENSLRNCRRFADGMRHG